MEQPLTDEEYRERLLNLLGTVEKDNDWLAIEALEGLVLDAGMELPLVRRQALEHEGWYSLDARPLDDVRDFLKKNSLSPVEGYSEIQCNE